MKESYKEFVKQIIFWGRFTLLAAWICSFLPPLYLAVVYGIMPEVTSIVKAFSMIASVMLVSWIVEPIAYFPIVGITGTYMSWLAGNISNMRVPVRFHRQPPVLKKVRLRAILFLLWVLVYL